MGDQPYVRWVVPTDGYAAIFERLTLETDVRASLIMDAALAALAIEHGATLASSDSDFGRFPNLKWKNPLKSSLRAMPALAIEQRCQSVTRDDTFATFRPPAWTGSSFAPQTTLEATCAS